MILGMAKSLDLTRDQVLKASYANLIMFSGSLPSYDSSEKDEDRIPFDETRDANNPDNFQSGDDEIVVKR